MRLQAKVTFAMRDLDRLKCIQAVIDRQLKVYQAAERLGLSSRQVLRPVRRYNAEGPIGLISKHRNRPGNRGLKPALAGHVLAILREQYADFGPTLAAESQSATSASAAFCGPHRSFRPSCRLGDTHNGKTRGR